VGVGIARVADRFDQGVVDGTVNLVSSISLFSGDRLRRIQTGIVSNYAALVTLGLVLLLVAFGFTGGWF
jgi:NADH-quinone oxidoreductase subunit L